MNRRQILLLGIAAVLGFSALWHGPLGAGERLAMQAEAAARRQLDHDEMFRVQAHLQRRPFARRLVVSGPADNFQRAEIARRLDEIPGVVDVQWDAVSLTQQRTPRP